MIIFFKKELRNSAIERPEDPSQSQGKMYPFWPLLSWQLLGAPPKTGSGKQKGSLCKTFSKKTGKNKCKCFPQLQGGGGEGTEQTPGLDLLRALSKEALSQTGLSLRRRPEGEGRGTQKRGQFQAVSCRQQWVQLRCGVWGVYY